MDDFGVETNPNRSGCLGMEPGILVQSLEKVFLGVRYLRGFDPHPNHQSTKDNTLTTRCSFLR